MKLSNLVNLKPLKEESTGAFGMAAKDLAATYSLERLQSIRDEVMGDMEQEAEPEGGRIADMYADQLHGLDQAIAIKKGESGEMTYDDMLKKHYPDKYGKRTTIAKDKDAFTKSSKFDRMNEATEKSWNAVDVSRKAEKEISNKEWNERTTKKLDMLKALNTAGKFKKDWGEEKLQGWVDQNYSWEKLSRQFKLNESYLSMYETMQQGDYSAIEQGWDGLPWDEQRDIINTAYSGEARPDEYEKDFDQLKSEIPGWESLVANYLGIDEGEDFRLEPEDLDNPDEDLVIIGSGYLDIKSNFGERPSQTNGEYAALGQKVVDQLHNGDKEAALDYILSQINEGSCGYSQEAPGGEELDTPGGTKGMKADTRTMTMMREVIKKEIKKLYENK